jgi:DNA primase
VAIGSARRAGLDPAAPGRRRAGRTRRAGHRRHLVGVLHRYPNGAGTKGFWHKELPDHFDQTRAWVQELSRMIGAVVPDLVSWKWQKSDRGGLARLD